MPYSTIAAQLGVSVGKVQRELAKFNAGQNGNGAASAPAAPPAFDPELSDHRRRLELDRIELARKRLDVDKLELDHRMALLTEAGKKGGDSAMWALVMGEINRLRESIAHGAPGGQGGNLGIVDELSHFREVSEIVKAMAPAPTMSGREGLEFNIALERIRTENERIWREKQSELENRRIEIEGQAARDHALAKLIEGLGPVASRAAEKWVESRTNGGQAPASNGAGGPPALPEGAASAAAAGRGHCPSCGYPPNDQEMELIPSGGEDKCPGCSANLTVVDGRIALVGSAAAAGGASPAGRVAQPSTNGQGPALPTFTS